MICLILSTFTALYFFNQLDKFLSQCKCGVDKLELSSIFFCSGYSGSFQISFQTVLVKLQKIQLDQI